MEADTDAGFQERAQLLEQQAQIGQLASKFGHNISCTYIMNQIHFLIGIETNRTRWTHSGVFFPYPENSNAVIFISNIDGPINQWKELGVSLVEQSNFAPIFERFVQKIM